MVKGSSQGSASMDQVRELLVGTQLKDMENRFQRQEEQFHRELADLQNHFKNRLDSLENFMKSETATMMHRLREEQAERAAAVKTEQRERAEALAAEQKERVEAFTKLSKELATLDETLERRLVALSGTLDTTERELRQLHLAENSRLADKIDEKYKDALTALGSTSDQIRNDMASRSTVSSLLTEMAMKLSGQWADIGADSGASATDDEA